MGHETPQPWERQAGESEAAYRAFCAYRDLGEARTVTVAFRQSEGKPEAKQASGRWNRWVKDHSWQDRCLAWDRRTSAVRQAAVEKVVAASGADWARRREELYEQEHRLGLKLLDQAARLASLPVTAIERDEGGAIRRIEALPPTTLRQAALVALDGSELARSAIDAAIANNADSEPVRVSRDVSEAESRLETWRAQMRERVLTLPAEPPDDLASPPTSDAGRAGPA